MLFVAITTDQKFLPDEEIPLSSVRGERVSKTERKRFFGILHTKETTINGRLNVGIREKIVEGESKKVSSGEENNRLADGCPESKTLDIQSWSELFRRYLPKIEEHETESQLHHLFQIHTHRDHKCKGKFLTQSYFELQMKLLHRQTLK